MEPDTNILKYRALEEVADSLSFTRASERLGVSQSGISRMISDLEREWGFRLFDRDRNGASLTPEAEALMPHVRALCSDYRSLGEQIGCLREPSSGHLRIGAFSSVATYWLPSMIRRFQEDHPGISYEILMGDYTELEAWVSEGRVDFAFSRQASDSSLESAFVEQDEYMAVLSAGDPLAGEESIPSYALNGRRFMLLEKGGGSDVGDYLEANRAKPDVFFRTWDDCSVISMVREGLGIGVLPSLILRGLPEGVIAVPLSPPLYRRICVIRRGGRPLPPAAESFLGYLGCRR